MEGLDIVLPYPEGTSKDTHDFMISHMFTSNVNGHHPGELENPVVIKMDDGLHLRVDGLSPFMIGYKEIEQNTAGENDSSGQPETTPVLNAPPSEATEGAIKAPKMNDEVTGVWIVVISLLGIGLFMIVLGTRRDDYF